MTISIKEIKELKTYLIDTYHMKRVDQQLTDDKYINDKFDLSFLGEGSTIVHTGKGYRMVSAPAEHIITSNPQVFREVKGKGEKQAERVTTELNHWAKLLLRQNPQPYKEFVKKLLGRGEAWIYTLHNNDYRPNDPNCMPIKLIIPDPLIVFGDGWIGEEHGVPKRVIISYQRVAANIQRNYPYWTWRNQKARKPEEKVPFFMYIDEEVRYYEADEEALLTDAEGNLSNGEGIQENIYGFVPFVHAYSGFGEGQADGDPVGLAVGRLTKIRDLLEEYTAIRSALNTLIFKYAYPPMDYEYDPTLFTPPADLGDNYDRSLGAFNKVPITPGGGLKKGVDMLPDQQLFQYLISLERQIDEEDPLGIVGQAIGTSGRQQDMARESALRRYDTVVDNTAHAFASAFGQGLKMLGIVPNIYPEVLNQGDIADNYECRLELKADDPIERDRLAVLGERLQQVGQIDWRTNLTKYQGYNDEEAQNIMNRAMVDRVILTDPIIQRLIAIQTAREMGMADQYEQLEAQLQTMEKAKPATPQTGIKGGEPREGNIQTELGMEQADMSTTKGGMRSPPVMSGMTQ